MYKWKKVMLIIFLLKKSIYIYMWIGLAWHGLYGRILDKNKTFKKTKQSIPWWKFFFFFELYCELTHYNSKYKFVYFIIFYYVNSIEIVKLFFLMRIRDLRSRIWHLSVLFKYTYYHTKLLNYFLYYFIFMYMI